MAEVAARGVRRRGGRLSSALYRRPACASPRPRPAARRGRGVHHAIPAWAWVGCAGLSARAARAVRLLRLWALATGVLAAALAVWAWAPVVVFLVLLTAALGVLSAGMIAL